LAADGLVFFSIFLSLYIIVPQKDTLQRVTEVSGCVVFPSTLQALM